MSYELTALMAAPSALGAMAVELPGAVLVPLPQGVALLPLTDETVDTFTGGSCTAWEEGFSAFPTSLAERVAHHSWKGPIAYVEAEFFGGTGSQDVRVWQDGAAVLELHEDPERPVEHTAPSPISQALRLLGVRPADHDEFDAVGLGRHRRTEDWYAPPEG